MRDSRGREPRSCVTSAPVVGLLVSTVRRAARVERSEASPYAEADCRHARSRRTDGSWSAARRRVIAAAVLVLGAALSLYWVTRIGDAGARAAWSDVVEAGG
ncbi:MAG: hypothetical protein ACR2KO_11885 [Geodermatophilaceae bacterium]